jgi:tRNA threonylcarbamoyladenosine biosynthesis protein TsaE
MKVVSESVNDTLKIGRAIARNLRKGDILCLFGELGSGKTVLIKGIAQGLGITKNEIISPTFVLMRQVQTKDNVPFFHFDFYRLKGCADILSLGYEEYFYNDGISVIEWADRLKHLLPQEYLRIKLGVVAAKKRSIEFVPFGRRYEKLIENLRH